LYDEFEDCERAESGRFRNGLAETTLGDWYGMPMYCFFGVVEELELNGRRAANELFNGLFVLKVPLGSIFPNLN